MNKLMQSVKNFWNDEEGLTAVEYAVAGGVIATGVVGMFGDLGDQVLSMITNLKADLAAENV